METHLKNAGVIPAIVGNGRESTLEALAFDSRAFGPNVTRYPNGM